MDKSTLFSKLRVLNIKPRIKSSNQLSNVTRSTQKGRGMSFSEVREYQFGDEVRTIDWNVTARYNIPHVKIFEEEKEQHYLIILDASSSSLFGDANQYKWEKQVEVAAMIAFTAWKKNERVGVLIFSDTIDLYIPQAKGRQHFYFLMNKLLEFKPKTSRTLLDVPLNWLFDEKIPRSSVFFVSDFMSTFDLYEQVKRANYRHQLVFIHVQHTEEAVLPNVGWLQMENLESRRKTWINTSSQKTRAAYEAYFDNQHKQLEQMCKGLAIKLAKISSDKDTYHALNAL